VTYIDATGVVTFNAGESPTGVTDLNFTGNIVLDMSSGDVTGIAGTWTGRAVLSNAPLAARPEVTKRPDFTHKRTYEERHGATAAKIHQRSRLTAHRRDWLVSDGNILAERRQVVTHCIPSTAKLRPFRAPSYGPHCTICSKSHAKRKAEQNQRLSETLVCA
jgi:hypothetical protein